MTTTSTAVLVAAALAAGFALGQSTSTVSAQSAVAKPAFLIASTRPTAPDKMAAYREKAMPLARAAGLEIIASGNPALHVLEGEWTLDGGLTIERYRSMDDLLAFWNSAGYREAVKLRTPYSKTNFIVALEGR